MKTVRPISLLLLASFFLVSPVPAEAGRITQKAFRKFKGIYQGDMSGVYGESTGGLLDLVPTAFDTDLRVTSRRVVSVASPTGRLHTLRYSRPTGSKHRVKLRGIYLGSFVNPHTGFSEPIAGDRHLTMTDKGRGRNFRFLMNAREVLEEGSLSYLNATGRLAKER